MAFARKDWVNGPDSPTKVSAEALEDMETRLSDYTDDVAAGLGGATGPNVVQGGALGAAFNLDASGHKETWLVGQLTANCVITITGLAAGSTVRLLLTQDGTGGRTVAVKVGAPAGVPVPFPTDANGTGVVDCYSPDGVNLYVKGAA
jgi:hypothetical protein